MSTNHPEYAEDYTEPLEIATRAGDLQRVRTIINDWRSHPELDETNLEVCIQTCADLAAQHDQPAILRLLLENGAEASTTLVASAAKTGTPEVFQLLYDHGWRPDHVGTRDRMLVILRAVNNSPLLKWLLDKGADPNAVSLHNHTVLSSAANSATPAEIDLLLAHGAKLQGSNALHSAVRRGSTPSEERLEMMQYLLDLGIDINALEALHVKPPKPRGRGSALHVAVSAGKAGRVKWLLEHGADVNAKVEGGRTALEWAQEGKQKECAEVLRQYGAT
ncbi:Uu.00g077630.m01.CDS01 [Anthostomella pinea]|uniref:Uu.00g077630.m01.CDS01 n=1 Tax=Anthostomella pinea TaxID=933095 RepID=A0AAI8YPB3_9PEZI|nr:Uu.00g077630.m01.CDS01 [Anthostomella pinea]